MLLFNQTVTSSYLWSQNCSWILCAKLKSSRFSTIFHLFCTLLYAFTFLLNSVRFDAILVAQFFFLLLWFLNHFSTTLTAIVIFCYLFAFCLRFSAVRFITKRYRVNWRLACPSPLLPLLIIRLATKRLIFYFMYFISALGFQDAASPAFVGHPAEAGAPATLHFHSQHWLTLSPTAIGVIIITQQQQLL